MPPTASATSAPPIENATAKKVQGTARRSRTTRRKLQEAPVGTGYVRVWSRVWEWPIPPDVYVAPEVVRA